MGGPVQVNSFLHELAFGGVTGTRVQMGTSVGESVPRPEHLSSRAKHSVWGSN